MKKERKKTKISNEGGYLLAGVFNPNGLVEYARDRALCRYRPT